MSDQERIHIPPQPADWSQRSIFPVFDVAAPLPTDTVPAPASEPIPAPASDAAE